MDGWVTEWCQKPPRCLVPAWSLCPLRTVRSSESWRAMETVGLDVLVGGWMQPTALWVTFPGGLRVDLRTTRWPQSLWWQLCRSSGMVLRAGKRWCDEAGEGVRSSVWEAPLWPQEDAGRPGQELPLLQLLSTRAHVTDTARLQVLRGGRPASDWKHLDFRLFPLLPSPSEDPDLGLDSTTLFLCLTHNVFPASSSPLLGPPESGSASEARPGHLPSGPERPTHFLAHTLGASSPTTLSCRPI